MYHVNASAEGQAINLQQLIDEASAGETVILDTGLYDGPVDIDKSLTIIGNGEVIIRNIGNDAVLTISGDHVNLQHVTILDHREQPNHAAIMVSGHHHQIEHVRIETYYAGIRLEQATDNVLQHLEIVRQEPSHVKVRRGHGIDLWESDSNVIAYNQITHVMDGVYVEKSHGNLIHNNDVTHSRYGYHFMFSDENELSDNYAAHNMSGAMIMGVKRSVVRGNVLEKQSGAVNALGLLLYNAYQTHVEGNMLTENRLGMFVESSHDNTIINNELSRNFIALQLLGAKDNEFQQNVFIANVLQAQAQQSADNIVMGNYWDDAQGIDLKGDGMSDLPYRVDPLFLTITEAIPAFQLFFASPSLQVFEYIMYSPSELWFQDEQPLMAPPQMMQVTDHPSRLTTGMVASLLLLGSGAIIIRSEVRK